MEKLFDFAVNSNYDFDNSLIDINNGVAKLRKEYANPVNILYGLVASTTGTASSIERITNGDFTSYSVVQPGSHFILFDLGHLRTLRSVKMFRPWFDNRKYKQTVVQLSENGTDWITIYNNDTNNNLGLGPGSDTEYIETSAGKEFVVKTLDAQYLRIWGNGSNISNTTEYIEIEAFEFSYPIQPASLKTLEIITANLLSNLEAQLGTIEIGSELKFNIIIDDVEYWHDGVDWRVITTLDVHRSNTLIEIINNWTNLIVASSPVYVQFRIWFISADGKNSPLITGLKFIFDLNLSLVPSPRIRVGYDWVYDGAGNPISGVEVRATLVNVNPSNIRYVDGLNDVQIFITESISVTDSAGFFKLNFLITERLNTPTARYLVQTSTGYQKYFSVSAASFASFNIGKAT